MHALCVEANGKSEVKSKEQAWYNIPLPPSQPPMFCLFRCSASSLLDGQCADRSSGRNRTPPATLAVASLAATAATPGGPSSYDTCGRSSVPSRAVDCVFRPTPGCATRAPVTSLLPLLKFASCLASCVSPGLSAVWGLQTSSWQQHEHFRCCTAILRLGEIEDAFHQPSNVCVLLAPFSGALCTACRP